MVQGQGTKGKRTQHSAPKRIKKLRVLNKEATEALTVKKMGKGFLKVKINSCNFNLYTHT